MTKKGKKKSAPKGVQQAERNDDNVTSFSEDKESNTSETKRTLVSHSVSKGKIKLSQKSVSSIASSNEIKIDDECASKKKDRFKSPIAKRREEEARRAKEAELKLRERKKAQLQIQLLKDKIKKEKKEQEMRISKLAHSCDTFKKISREGKEMKSNVLAEETWRAYLRCDQVPDPLNIKDINLFICKWQSESDPKTLEDLVPNFHKVLGIIDIFNDYITHPPTTATSSLETIKYTRNQLCVEMFNKINKLSSYIMRDMKSFFKSISAFCDKFVVDTEPAALGFYSRNSTTKCISENDDNDIELPIIADFPELGLSIRVPYQLMYETYVVRVVWKKYDDFSILSNSFNPLPMPIQYKKDMYEFVVDEYAEITQLRHEYEQALKTRGKMKKRYSVTSQNSMNLKETSAKSNHSEPSEDVISENMSMTNRSSMFNVSSKTSEQFNESRTPSKEMLIREEENANLLATYLKQNVKNRRTVLNLRQYAVLGGTYQVEFLQALQQPKLLSNLSKVYVAEEGELIKPISFSLNTNQVIRKVYSKYRDRFSRHPVKKMDTVKSKKAQKKASEDKQRIEVNLNRLSFIVEKRMSNKPQNPQADEKKVSGIAATEINSRSSVASRSSVGSSISSTMSENRSSVKSLDLIDTVDAEMDSISKIVPDDESVASIDSQDSYKSRDSMFEEYEIKTYDPANFRPKIKIRLLKNVLYFEKPFPVIWNSKYKWWIYNNKTYIFDIEYEENASGELVSVSFRYSKLESPLALAVLRYGPLPFTNWNLFPDTSKCPVENVTFYLETEFVTIEFDIKLDEICLKYIDIRLPNQNQQILDKHIGKYYKPFLLISKMRNVGLDMFPDHDSYLYMTKPISKKHYVMENHTYRCMALLSSTHSFKWSNWNHLTSSHKILMKVKEEIKCSLKFEANLCLIKPHKAVLFNEQEIEHNKLSFQEQSQPDLYWLLEENSCTTTKHNIKNCNKLLSDTVYHMLGHTLIHSYS